MLNHEILRQLDISYIEGFRFNWTLLIISCASPLPTKDKLSTRNVNVGFANYQILSSSVTIWWRIIKTTKLDNCFSSSMSWNRNPLCTVTSSDNHLLPFLRVLEIYLLAYETQKGTMIPRELHNVLYLLQLILSDSKSE